MRKLNIISENLFHKAPRKNPPRYDLRKHKNLDDPDFEELEEEKDPDLETKSS